MSLSVKFAAPATLSAVPLVYGLRVAKTLTADVALLSHGEILDALVEGRVDVALLSSDVARAAQGVKIVTDFCVAPAEKGGSLSLAEEWGVAPDAPVYGVLLAREDTPLEVLDEIEKAHPDVFNTLLQVLDDGRLTDSKGRTVNFKNTLIIMTSNYSRERLYQSVRPEFLNRVDEIITFEPLSEEQIKEVVKLQINIIKKRLAESDIQLQMEDSALELLAREGYDPDFGARPVKRAIQRLLLDHLSMALLSGAIDRSKPIKVKSDGEKLEFGH